MIPSWSTIYFLSEWVIRLIMLVYVPQKRSPAAARTWLLLIFVLPWPGLVLYGLFGRAYLPRRRLEFQQKISERIKTAGKAFFRPYIVRPELPSQFLHLINLAENLGDFPIMGGNRVELLADYEQAVARLVADIDQARAHVHLLYYIFADDATGQKVIDALGRATARGVRCQVLFDSVGSKAWRKRLLARLQEKGIETHVLLPVGLFRRGSARFDLRNHRKIAVIDGRIGHVGSQNLVNADFKPGIVYEELVARIAGPVVLQLQAVFLVDRLLELEKPESLHGFFPQPEQPGSSAVQTLPSGPGYPQANNQRLIVTLIHAAQKRVVVTTPYFIPDEPLLQAMETAVQRGVEVHLVVSRTADQVLVSLAQRSFYEDLLEAGVQVHVYRDRFLHAKHVSVDDAVALIGSSNMDLRSFLLNAEISVLVYDAPLVAELGKVQEHYFANADLLSLNEWRKRPLYLRTLQNMARLIDALL